MKDYFLKPDGTLMPRKKIQDIFNFLMLKKLKQQKNRNKKLKAVMIALAMLFFIYIFFKKILLVPVEWRLVVTNTIALIEIFLYFLFGETIEN